jgi:hypothetical protein
MPQLKDSYLRMDKALNKMAYTNAKPAVTQKYGLAAGESGSAAFRSKSFMIKIKFY